MSDAVEEVLVPGSEGRGVYVKKGQLLDIVERHRREPGARTRRTNRSVTDRGRGSGAGGCNS